MTSDNRAASEDRASRWLSWLPTTTYNAWSSSRNWSQPFPASLTWWCGSAWSRYGPSGVLTRICHFCQTSSFEFEYLGERSSRTFLQPWTRITNTDIRPSCSLRSFANCGAKIDQFNYVENSCILKQSYQFNVLDERLICRLQWGTHNLQRENESHNIYFVFDITFLLTYNFLFDFKI